jgi:hypothetical protein
MRRHMAPGPNGSRLPAPMPRGAPGVEEGETPPTPFGLDPMRLPWMHGACRLSPLVNRMGAAGPTCGQLLTARSGDEQLRAVIAAPPNPETSSPIRRS